MCAYTQISRCQLCERLEPFSRIFCSVYLLSIWLHGKSALHNPRLWYTLPLSLLVCLLHMQPISDIWKGILPRVSRPNRANIDGTAAKIGRVQFNPFIKFTINPGNFRVETSVKTWKRSLLIKANISVYMQELNPLTCCPLPNFSKFLETL